VHGYLRKLSGENNIFVPTSFETRFCVIDLSTLNFKYAKSPKEKYTEIVMDEILFVGTKDD